MNAAAAQPRNGQTPPALIPSVDRALPRAVHARGTRIFAEDGRDYIDASSGPLAVSLGHGHPAVVNALALQLSRVDYVHRTQFRTPAVERFAAAVVDRMGPGLDHVMMVSSGSEANELAMKFAHLYWAAQGLPQKSRFVSSSLSYHGNTVGALSASGQPRYGAAYRPLLHDVEHIRAPKSYRLDLPDGTTPAQVWISRLHEDFARLDLTHTAAVLFESVGGSASGVLVPPPGYLEELRRLCDQHDVLWIADEVMSGFGRTGTWFGYQHSATVPDIVTFAKGAGAGVVPLGGAALSGPVWEQISRTYPAMGAGHTFTNAAASCAVGLAVIDTIESTSLLDRVATNGRRLGDHLCHLRDEFDIVGDVRGLGYMWGIEFVSDPLTQAPFPTSARLTEHAIATAVDNGLILYPARACHDGQSGDAVMVAPPLTTSDDEFEELHQRLASTIAALQDRFAGSPSRPHQDKDSIA